MRQGYEKDLKVRGICRAISQENSVDGVCDDMMNLHLENGSWKAMKHFKEEFVMQNDYSNVWIHVGSDYKHAFGTANNKVWWFADIDDTNQWISREPVELCDYEEGMLFCENGNLVTVGGRIFLLWMQGDERYTIYNYDQNGRDSDEVLKPDGDIKFRVVPQRSTKNDEMLILETMDLLEDDCDFVQRTEGGEKIKTPFPEITNDVIRAGYLKLLKEHEVRNSFHSPFLVCAAYKTYSGDYVMATRPLLMYPQSKYYNHKSNVEAVKVVDGKNEHVSTSVAALLTPGNFRVEPNEFSVSLKDGAAYINDKKKELDNKNNFLYTFIEKGKLNDNITLYSLGYKTDDSKYPNSQLVGKIPAFVKYNNDYARQDYAADMYFCPEEFMPTKNMYTTNYWRARTVMGVRTEYSTNRYYCNGALTKLQIKAKPIDVNHRDIFTELCIFVTPMVDEYNQKDFFFDKIGVDETSDHSVHLIITTGDQEELHGDRIYANTCERRTTKEVVNRLLRSNFYLISSIDAKSLTDEWVDVDIEDGVLANIVQQDILPADTTMRDGIEARGSYSYNGRLHLYDYDSNQFHGYPLTYFFENEVSGCMPIKRGYDNQVKNLNLSQAQRFDQSTGQTEWLNNWTNAERGWSWYVGVELERDDGATNVVRYAPFQTDAYKLDGEGLVKKNVFAREFCSLNGCISYPDARAKKMFVYVRSSVKGTLLGDVTRFYYHEFLLTPHERLNMACYISDDLCPIDITPTMQMIDPQKQTYEERNTTRRVANGLRVSAVDNPLYLPAEYSYLVGNVGIVGMMANEIAVGTGQTGDAPLFIFCKDGVYGFFVDSSGVLAYKYARPIASDVCNNAASIVREDGGIVFGTDRGLMMIKGATVSNIGEIACGDYFDFANDTVNLPEVLRGAFTHRNICNFDIADTTDQDFRDYQKKALIGYNYKEKETWVCNTGKGYVYVKDFDGNWRRVNEDIRQIVPCYPETFALVGNKVVNLDRYQGTYERRVFALTRPIAIRSIAHNVSDSNARKETYRIVCRGEFNASNNNVFKKYFGIYVLGSYDGKRWAVIGGNERFGQFVDIGCLVERVDVKYLMVCLSGNLGSGGKIDGLTIECKYK